MKVSDLIPALHRLWEEHGDLEVRGYDYSSSRPTLIETPQTESREGETYVLLRP
ncbi:hypothetical protein ACIQZO_06095 [Streptomyces sp. NPDC097617]|uniref:hypothetical protein n=1 Tax=Streptomyces sp. NPDC097617 TaxID=3366091 RepID=UPI00380925B6